MAQHRSTRIISMIKWVRTSRVSIKDSLSLCVSWPHNLWCVRCTFRPPFRWGSLGAPGAVPWGPLPDDPWGPLPDDPPLTPLGVRPPLSGAYDGGRRGGGWRGMMAGEGGGRAQRTAPQPRRRPRRSRRRCCCSWGGPSPPAPRGTRERARLPRWRAPLHLVQGLGFGV